MKRAFISSISSLILGCLSLPVLTASAQQPGEPKPTDVKIINHVYEPVQLKVTDNLISQLKLPDGFRIQKFAEGLGKPRIMTVAPDGTVYVTRRDPGDERGNPTKIEPFLTGFLVKMNNGDYGRFARPVGVAVAKDGSLLIGDNMNGVIYRISYAK